MTPKVSEQYKEQKRIELLMAAKNVFERKGFEPTTFADIIEEAGVSRGTIYLYFSNKDEVFEGLLDLLEQQGTFNVEMYIEQFPSVWDAIIDFLKMQETVILHSENGLVPAIYEYSIISWRDAKKREKLYKRHVKSKELLSVLLEQGVTKKQFQPTRKIEEISAFIVTFMNGLTFDTLNLGVNEEHVQSQMELIKKLLKEMLGVNK